ncbi:oxidoreductase [[Haemophilus] felis]|uniref:Aspartate-semialdehyde dehydrogenase n=1 Tax=[Haemophilus] felis TaxID=123822 RepID=A0A1T0B7T3_9PAST|nr:oxidoreductase [[Haemophilus] felis]NBI40758.1 oxidoreductase [[Haemophilus] felis]OOS06197.1 aspartate-semialdehyde dehydrogenase [[Haemophilus] felis]
MNTTLNIALAGEFELCEKIAEMLEQSELNVQNLSIVEIFPFTEEQGVRFNNKAVPQIEPDKADWATFDYLFFAGNVEQAAHILSAADAGCVVIDMKGVCATLSEVPVVVPTVNEADLVELRQRNIVALPDPQVSQFALLMQPILQNANVANVSVTSLLPASYFENENVRKLAGQTAQLLNGIPLDEGQQRLAFDVLPLIQGHLARQAQKIFPQLDNVTLHAVQVPVFYGLGQMLSVTLDYEFDQKSILNEWQQHSYIEYHSEKVLTPVTNGEQESQQDSVQLHINLLNTQQTPAGIELQCWSVADEQRFNLAWLAVKLAEAVVKQGF